MSAGCDARGRLILAGHTRITGATSEEAQEGSAAVPVGGGGAWPGTPEPQAPPVWRAPEGSAAVPVGGGGAWPGFETTRRAKLAARTARGRAAAHRHTQRPGPPAPETPAAPQAQAQQSGPEPLGSGPPSMLSGDQRTTRVSSARPPCRPCRSSRRRTSPRQRAYSRSRGSHRSRSSRRRNARGHRASRRSR